MLDQDFFTRAVIAGMPLLFAILGETITERAGKLNLGVEGMMLVGAVCGFAASFASGSATVGMLAALLAGATASLIFAFLTITLRANQVVTGLALTMFGTGFAGYMGKHFMGEKLASQGVKYEIPVLCDIPGTGQVFFNQNVMVYLGYICVIVMGIYLYHTRKGLSLRAVGENTAAADAAGINVTLYRYVHVLIGGALCGIAGAFLSIVYIPAWQENVTAGKGWIAIALVIFSKWNPYYAFGAAILFGGLDIVGFRIQDSVDAQWLLYVINALPYFLTTVILIFVSVRQSREGAPPAMLGLPYFREDR